MGLVNKPVTDKVVALDTMAGSTTQPAADLATLVTQLQHTNIAIRREAAKALRYFPQGEAALLELLEQEGNSLVIDAAFDSLLHFCKQPSRIGHIVARVVALMGRSAATTRNAAILFLSSFPDAVASHMPALLEDDSPDIQLYALDVLRGMNHPSAPQWFQTMLGQPLAVNVLVSLLERVAECQAKELAPAIQAAADQHPEDPLVAFASELALQRLGGDSE